MWTAEHTLETSAPPEAVWGRWVDPTCWPEHNDQVEAGKLDGPLRVGAKILIKPVGSKESSTIITTLDPYERFTSEAKIPFGRLRFDHFLSQADGRTTFTQQMSITGPLTPILRRAFANKMAAGLPTMMANIARLAEAGDRG